MNDIIVAVMCVIALTAGIWGIYIEKTGEDMLSDEYMSDSEEKEHEE